MGQILKDIKSVSELLREQSKKWKDEDKAEKRPQKPYEVPENAAHQEYVH